MSQTEGQPSSVFNMSVNSSVERRGDEKKEAADLEHHSLDRGRADAHYSQLGVPYQLFHDKH